VEAFSKTDTKKSFTDEFFGAVRGSMELMTKYSKGESDCLPADFMVPVRKRLARYMRRFEGDSS